MRVSRVKADENRRRIIDTASRLFRCHGFDGIGLAALMKGARLTQGGFYKQFASKEALMVSACERAVTRMQERWRVFAARDPRRPLTSLVQSYLSPDHRDEVADGCAIAALGADAARTGPAVRAVLEDGLRAHVAELERLLADTGDAGRQRALATLATMVGALLLSRSINDEALSQDILDAAARGILAIKNV